MAQLKRRLKLVLGIPPAPARDGYNFLPQDSVVISDRTRQANKLGEGSFAKVYRGQCNGKPCAVKVFKEDVLKKEWSLDPENEAEMLSKVQHTNIVQIYGLWYDPYKERAAASIVMELCDDSLYDFIRRHKGKVVPKEQKLPILRDIARGMVYLHGLNIIHGDLRSSNILLVHSGDQTVAKLADFDMAQFLDPCTQCHLTTRFTDEEYLPPEVFDHKEGKDHKKKWALLTPKVDVFCFGEVVLELACGSYPKPVNKYNGREMLTELKRRDRYLVKLKQSDKESLGTIVRKCLADAPDSRPDFTEILHDVEGYLHKYGERPDLEKLQDKTAECELLRAQAFKWEDDSKSLCSAQDRVDLLERELDITKEEKQDLQVTLDILQTHVEDLKMENQELSKRERDALEKSHTMSGKIRTLELQLRDAKEDLDGKNQLLGTRDAELRMVHAKIDDLEAQVKKKQDDWADLGESYLKVMGENDTLTCELVQVKAERDELDKHKKTMEKAKTAADMELDKTRKERDALQEGVKAGHLQLRDAKEDLDGKNQLIGTRDAGLKILTRQLIDSEVQMKKKEADWAALEESYRKVMGEKDTLMRELVQVKAEKDELDEQKKTMEEAKTAADMELDKTRKERDALWKDVRAGHVIVGELQDKSHNQETIIQQLNRYLLNMRQEIEKLMNQGDTLRQEIEKLMNQGDTLRKERDHLKSSLNTTEEKFGSTAKERDHFQKKLQEKESADATLLKSLRAKEEELKVLKKRNATAENSSKGKDDRIARLQATVSEMDVQLKRERSAWTSERNVLNQELAKVEETAEAQLKTAESSLAATIAQQAQAVAAKDEMAATLQQLQEEWDHLKQQYQKELAEKVEELIWLKKDVITWSKELEEAHEAINKGNATELEQRKKIEHIEDDKKDLMDKLQKHTDKLEKKKKELTEAVDSQRILKQELDWKISVVEELKHERDRLAYSVQEYKRKLSEIATHNKDLEEQRDEEARECRSIKRDLETALADVVKQREMLSAKDVKLSKLEKEQAHFQSECDKSRAQLTGVQQEAQIRLESLKASKAMVEKDLARARKMCRDLMDERLAVNAECEQNMDNLNDQLVEFKQVAVLSEERLGQIQGLKDEHRGLKLQLKKLTTALVDFQHLVTIERKSRKSLDASVKTLKDEVSQLRTELKGRNDEVLALASANMQLQRKADRADATIGGVQSEAATLKEQVKQLTQDNNELKQTLDGAEAAVRKQKRDYEDSQSKTVTLKEQVKRLSEANSTLKQTLDGAEAAVLQHKRDYEDSQEKLREAEHQVAMLQSKRQRIEMLEGVAEELKTQLSGLKTDAPLINPAVGSEGKEAAQKMQMLEVERDNYKAELHMYQMQWIAAGDLLEAVKKEKQFLEENLRETEHQVAMLQSKRQQVEVLEGVTEELKTQLSGLKTNAPIISPTMSSEVNGTSATDLTQEATQKVQRLEAERDSYKAELHMYQMKWCDAEELIETMQKQKQFLEKELELTRDDYKKKLSEALKLMKTLHDQEEGGAQSPPEMAMLSAVMDICKGELSMCEQERDRLRAEKIDLLQINQQMSVELQVRKEELEIEAVPTPLPPDVVEPTVDEALLQKLCYTATAIKQLHIGPNGGTFTLGSGDASLEVPSGAMEKETSVHYAIILHGPFVFPAGYKPGSVIVYLNMDGATLVKPIQLLLSHWCVREEGDDEESLRFISAPHTLEEGQQKYTFDEQEEEEADFTTRTNVGALTIRDPHCLFCVKTKIEKIARYSAIGFSRYIASDSEDTLLFRIQLMCDSLEWNEKLTTKLRHKKWEDTGGGEVVTRFQYAGGHHQITANPKEMAGPGWEAAIYGSQAVNDQSFLEPFGKSHEEIEREVNSGRFPPYFLYKIVYTGLEEHRVNSALVKVDLHGTNVPLSFSFTVKEEMSVTPPVSPATSQPVSGAVTYPSTMHMETAPVSTRRRMCPCLPCISAAPPESLSYSYSRLVSRTGDAISLSTRETTTINATDIIRALNHRLDAKWQHFGTFLGVEQHIMESIKVDKRGSPENCMLELVGKWTSKQTGTGTLPRTWQTVVEAVKDTGEGVLAENLALEHAYGVHLPH